MLNFISYLINEVNGTNTLKKAVNSIKSGFQNPLKKHLNKIKKSINKSMINNKLSKYKQDSLAHNKSQSREKIIKANASRIKRIQNTIKQNSINLTNNS